MYIVAAAVLFYKGQYHTFLCSDVVKPVIFSEYEEDIHRILI